MLAKHFSLCGGYAKINAGYRLILRMKGYRPMRLFIGIKTRCEDYLSGLQDELKIRGKGNFTDKGNLHLTLRFLGEVNPSEINGICAAMAETRSEAFDLVCRGVQLFNKSGIVSCKIEGELSRLSELYEGLESALEKKGFEKEARFFSPHITLARNFRPFGGFDAESVPHNSRPFSVNETILFESRREGARLVYVPLFTHRLEGVK
jgi:2'-5' RNA ligase